MSSSLAVDGIDLARDRERLRAWRLARLRRIGIIYGGICLACTLVEAAWGLSTLAAVYAVNTSLIFVLTACLRRDNQVLIERIAIGFVFGTCLVSVLLPANPMNFGYLLCLLCVTSIHEQDPRWRRAWAVCFWVSFAACAGYFAWAAPVALDPVPDYRRSVVPLLCSVALLMLLLQEYININRGAYANQAALNAELARQIDAGHASSRELEEQMLARQRVSRSVEQSIGSALRTRARLEANHEQLEQFAYAASHDLKEPVRTIRSFMQMVRRKLPPAAAADATLAEHFDYIESSAHAMHNVLERLLLYSRAGREKACAKTCNLRRVWAGAVAKSALGADLKQALLTDLVSAPAIPVEVDAAQVQTVFAELLDNACRFVAPGATPAIRIACEPARGGHVVTRLTDAGIGIDPAYLHQVFGLFTRLHPREQYPSAGVGLALVKRLLEQIGGTIELASEVGVGTTVTVTLPAAGPAGA